MLATKNPNEAEAASAARRVCKLLAEVNCEFEINVPDPPAKTWNDVTRSTEPGFSSRRPTSPGVPFDWTRTKNPNAWEGFKGSWSEPFNDEAARKARQEAQERARKEDEERSKRNRPFYERDYADIPDVDEILRNMFVGFDPSGTWKEREKKERRKLICKTCKEPKDTVFIGAPELFECNECQWTAYLRNKPISDY